MLKLFSVTTVNFGFLLNVHNNLNYLDCKYIFKTAMNPGTAQNAAAQSFTSPYLVTRKTSWFVAQTLIITPLIG